MGIKGRKPFSQRGSVPTIYLMLSGGVDSSVSAFILKELGFNVIGVYMLKWWNPSLGDNCPTKEDLEYVFRVSRILNIPVYVLDLRDTYKKYVLDKVLQDFKAGITPNPDTSCNRYIKFGALVKEIEKLAKGREFLVASGHYALSYNKHFLEVLGVSNMWHGRKQVNIHNISNIIYLPIDAYKDQTYFLYDVPKEVLHKIIFPLAPLVKKHVKQIAGKLNLKTNERKESSGICFIGDIELSKFLLNELGTKPGPIIDIKTNKQVGEHKGLWLYTIGQRKGLGIGGVSPAYYVVGKGKNKNILYVAQGRFNKFIFTRKFMLKNVNWHVDIKDWLNKELGVMIRYRSMPYKGMLTYENGEFVVNFIDNNFAVNQTENQGFWAVAPGQSAVLYSNIFDRQVPDIDFEVNDFINNVSKVYTSIMREAINVLQKNKRNVFMLGGGVIS